MIEMTSKQISISKVLCFAWLKIESFDDLYQQLKHQNLKSFFEIFGKI